MNDSDGFRYPNIIDFFGTRLAHICHFAVVDLRDYQAYDTYSENNLRSSSKSISDELTELIEKNDEQYHEDYIDSFAQDFHELGNIYPALHRKAMLITLYNFFEHQMKTLCDDINKLLPVNKSEEYLKSVDIKEYRKFLTREGKFDINQGGKLWNLWEDILTVQQIRHALVHSEGEIEKKRAKWQPDIESYCKRKKIIRLNSNRIIIDQGYVGDLITNLIEFFGLLDFQVSTFIRRYQEENGTFEAELPPGASRTPL